GIPAMRTLLCAAVALVALAPAAQAGLKLPSVFGSHMVLQRDKPIIIFGYADPGEKVSVTLDDDKATATANGQGFWKATLPARKASDKGAKLTVEGDGTTITHTDILVGDVWVGSGQSNMEQSVAGSSRPKETIDAAKHPLVRLYNVPRESYGFAHRDIDTT